jgi:plastocyanin
MTTPRAATALVLVLLASACSGSSDSTPTTQPTSPSGSSSSTAAGGATLTVRGFHYSALQVAPGTTITVRNLDDAEHTVTSDTKGLFGADDIGDTPKTFTAPTKPGTYTFHCRYHATMHGSLTVT